LTRQKWLAICVIIVLFTIGMPFLAQGGNGNAEVSRSRNLQCFEMTAPVHPPGDAYVTRTKNIQYFKMTTPSVHPLGDAYVSRLRNLQCFEMGPAIYLFKVDITSFIVTNQGGTPAGNLTKGEVAQFDYIIENVGTAESLSLSNGLITTIVLDPSETVVFLGYVFQDLSKGSSTEFVMGYKIPVSAPLGTYTARVAVFTDWPSEGGEGLAVKELTFNVV
jgi:hypothetical protein